MVFKRGLIRWPNDQMLWNLGEGTVRAAKAAGERDEGPTMTMRRFGWVAILVTMGVGTAGMLAAAGRPALDEKAGVVSLESDKFAWK